MNLDSLQWKEYRYVSEQKIRGHSTLRPKLNVKIAYGGKSIDVLGLLDTGGDCTIINAELADGLGINLAKCEQTEIGGIVGSEITARFAEVRISLEGFDEEFKIRVRFVEDMRTDIILGQSDMFEHFIAVFDRKKRKFFLAKN